MRSKRWRRTRSLVLLSLLLITSMVVWVRVFLTVPTIDQSVGCTPAAAGLSPVGYHDLDAVAPSPPDRMAVRVFNGSSLRGAARLMSLQLADLGFPLAADAADDPAYPLGNMNCVGQIRFGPQGAAAARTLSLLVPCAQLMRDKRTDATVDFSVGTNFNGLIVSPSARLALSQLTAWARQNPIPPGGLLTQDQARPSLAMPLLTAARPGHC
ncbi:envelope integrity protein Cei [Kutzneria chonburiensis]|uniref:Envelope integrity protein Cei n=1 Tax=Kutzneria chonburiensis TaxID=1483604 RepID=A0ABV6N895_9PSEU|nr:envelope integrity protein Cei [Kutzneria chonburiensis]